MTFTVGLRSIMFAASQAAEPEEACGLLLGVDHDVLFVAAVPNSHHRPDRHFRIAPAAAAPVVREAMRLGVDVIGGWHSHPNGPSDLSDDDVRGTPGDGFIQCVVGPSQSLRAWSVTPPHTATEIAVAFRR